MKRKVEIEMMVTVRRVSDAINRYFARHPELEEWHETVQWMAENKSETLNDCIFGDGSYNKQWTWAINLDIFDRTDGKFDVYICVIEREA